ncbi:MAG: VanZ family protein [Lachnospiraceae bacterium]|nr:VanZ family protein [Lachnospiraceae bacterium]
MFFDKKEDKRKSSVWNRRTIAPLLLCLCTLFIWHNSLQAAGLSGSRSLRLTQAVNDWFSTGGAIAETMIRKLAHFVEYVVEGVLVTAVTWAYELPLRRYIWHGALFGVLTALLDETFQLFMEGRAASVGDVWIDFCGFLSGVSLGVLFMWIRIKGVRRSR